MQTTSTNLPSGRLARFRERSAARDNLRATVRRQARALAHVLKATVAVAALAYASLAATAGTLQAQAAAGHAPTQPAPAGAAQPAGAPIVPIPTLTFEGARRIAAAAAEEAQRNRWNVSIAVVDEHGELLFFARLDGSHQQSVDISLAKARTAARWRRETKSLQDAVAEGRTVLLAVEGMIPLEGGVPIIYQGRVIGAVGVSGVTSAQDAQIAAAGIRAAVPPN